MLLPIKIEHPEHRHTREHRKVPNAKRDGCRLSTTISTSPNRAALRAMYSIPLPSNDRLIDASAPLPVKTSSPLFAAKVSSVQSPSRVILGSSYLSDRAGGKTVECRRTGMHHAL